MPTWTGAAPAPPGGANRELTASLDHHDNPRASLSTFAAAAAQHVSNDGGDACAGGTAEVAASAAAAAAAVYGAPAFRNRRDSLKADLEAAIRCRVEASRQQQASRAGLAESCAGDIELTSLKEGDAGGSLRWLSKGNIKAPEALENLIAETTRLLCVACPPLDQEEQLSDAAGCMAGRLADIIDTLSRKEEEVENLQAVLKDLAETRAKAMQIKASSVESLVQLQNDYGRVIKAAQVAQETVRSNACKLVSMREEVQHARAAADQALSENSRLKEANAHLWRQNEVLQQRVSMLEKAGQLSGFQHSLCQNVYTDLVVMRNVGLY